MVIAMSTPVHADTLLRADEAIDHIQGPDLARVTLIEYGDFECPACIQAHAAMKIILAHFRRRLRFVYRHFPQRQIHSQAELAAEAAEAASAQGKFWPFYDLLFEHPQHLEEKHLLAHARRLSLDLPRYQYEMKDHVYRQRVQEHLQSGLHLGLRATPTFFVNGQLADVSFGLHHLQAAIERVLPEPGQIDPEIDRP
jgi:protein-disulfide isomerase